MAQPSQLPRIVTLVRHAHAQWPMYSGRDFDRPLTPRGLKDALAAAREIRAAGLRPQVLLSSPAERTRTTAMILARELGLAPDALLFEDRLYNASADLLESVARDAATRCAQVMLVGHNPGISELAHRLAHQENLSPLAPAAWQSFPLTQA